MENAALGNAKAGERFKEVDNGIRQAFYPY
jgi:hypothetical protein